MFRFPTVILLALAFAAPAAVWGKTISPDEGTVAAVASAPDLEGDTALAPTEKTAVDVSTKSSQPTAKERRSRYGTHDNSYRWLHPYGVPPQVLPFFTGISAPGF